MSDRNWVNDLTFGCLAVAVFAVIATLCAKIIILDYAEIHQVYASYQDNADEDKREAQERIERVCVNRSPADATRCVSDELHAYYSKQATQADLQAQKDMAIWAKYMFFASLVGIPIAILGLFYVRRTLHEARLTTAAALEGAEIARQIGQAQVRAYLNISGGRYEAYTPMIRFHLDIANLGNSPATNIRLKVKVYSEININRAGKFPMMDLVYHEGRLFGVANITATATTVHAAFIAPESSNAEHYDTLYDTIVRGGWFKLSCELIWKDVFEEWHAETFNLKSDYPPEGLIDDTVGPYMKGTISADSGEYR